MLKWLLIVVLGLYGQTAFSQTVLQETFYYNPKGLTFVPALKKPSVIYQGKLFTGRRQLSALFGYLNNPALNVEFKKYKSNKTASALLTIAGVGLSVYSLLDWRTTSNKKFNWYTFGGGLAISGMSGYLDAKGNEHLRNAALIFDNATRKTTFVPAQPSVSFTIPLTR